MLKCLEVEIDLNSRIVSLYEVATVAQLVKHPELRSPKERGATERACGQFPVVA